MFQEPNQQQPEGEKAPPCDACGKESECEVWGHVLCNSCWAEWRQAPEPEVCREPPMWMVARGMAKGNQTPLDERAAAWRAAVESFVAARKARAA